MKLKLYSLMSMIMITLMLSLSFSPVFAEEIKTPTINEIPVEKQDTSNDVTDNKDPSSGLEGDLNGDGVLSPDEVLPDAKLEDVVSKVENKTSQVAVAIQRILSGACIVVFLIGCGKLLLGTFGHRGGWVLGVVTMVLASVAFVAINYAGPIMAWFSAWIVS